MSRSPSPDTRRSDHVDTYHGTAVPDPYRWLEDPNSEETRAWVEAQNAVTFRFLGAVPERTRLEARLTELWDSPKNGTPFARGGRYFQFRNTGLQNQSVLHVAPSPDGPWTVLLDPNGFSDDGTVALGSVSPSRDGRLLAYSVSGGGSDWQTWRVRDTGTGEDLPDLLEWSKFSGAEWLPDGSGFFYGRYPAPAEGETLTNANYGSQLCLHRLGTPQDEDEVIYARPDRPEWRAHATVTDDGRFLVVSVSRDTSPKNLLLWRPLGETGPFSELVSEFEAMHDFVGNDGGVFYLHTDAGAPRGKLVRVDVTRPDAPREDVLPETGDVLETVALLPGGLLALYQRDVAHRLERFDRNGAPIGEVALPALGSLSALSREAGSDEVFFGFTSFLFPAMSYRLDFGNGEARLLETPALTFDPSAYETRQEFVTSRDGTRVPMFLVHRKGLRLDGNNPTLLYGYGGFNISLTPSFSAGRLPWLEMGGVLAVANLRGGGEYGEEWHAAGTLERKQNVFDDFIACAEHLVATGVTRPSRLAIQGGSNGGLLVGACMTQRPDLFGACLPAVGVMDMLRFHQFTIGWAWVSDYGSSDDPEQFRTLLAYSPLHNIRPGTVYPATLVTTGDHDDRVVPAHSYKFAAALQHAQAGEAPVLIRIQTRAGHGAGKPTRLVIEETADILAFLVETLGMRETADTLA